MAKTTLSFRVTFDGDQVTQEQMNSYVHQVLASDTQHEVIDGDAPVIFNIDDVEVMGWTPMPVPPRDQEISGRDLT
jgi:hypothetical protein